MTKAQQVGDEAAPATRGGADSPMVCHLLTGVFWPDHGGMEDSVARVARALASWKREVRIYVRLTTPGPDHKAPEDLQVTYFAPRKARLTRPLGLSSGDDGAESYRLDHLLFREHVRASLQARPEARHFVLSFAISTSGVVGQQVASELRIPHVVACRGTDVWLDARDPQRIQRVAYVAEHADVVTTLCREQADILSACFGRRRRVHVVPNPFPPEIEDAFWSPPHRPCVRVFSDQGYEYRKGTQVLIDALEQVVADGADCELVLAGKTAPAERGYWEVERARLVRAYADRVRLLGFVDKETIVRELLGADVYAYATLGDGCSQARLRALGLGIPMVTTACGEMLEFGVGVARVSLAPPGDAPSFAAALARAVRCAPNTRATPRAELVHLRAQHTGAAELAIWERVIDEAMVP